MLDFLGWYLLITLIGWLAFPLAYRLFPALADRGFSLARVVGLLLWGYIFWLLASLGVIQNDGGGLSLAFVLLLLAAGLSLWRGNRWADLWDWLRNHRSTLLTTEILFFIAFAFLAFVRASNPQIETAGGEKTMETAFINSILRSPTFPPHDPWLSGYAISYYYFGYVMAAMLAKAAGTPGPVAHNLMTALIFALSFVGAYGIVYNLLAAWRKKEASAGPQKTSGFSIYGLPVLGPLFLLFVSNFSAFLSLLQKWGLFWNTQPDGSRTSAFWSWLGITELTNPPGSYYNWWWRASRVIVDLDLLKTPAEVIDEFPAFSYLLGDLHPHVLAMPFDLLAVAVGLNLFLGGWKGETDLYFFRVKIRPLGLFFVALVLGGLAFLNTWDILAGFALVAGAYVLTRVHVDGWSWRRLEDVLTFCIPVGVAAILLYLPFYVGFSSQAGGLLPNVIFPTRGAQLWVMFGPFFLVLFPFFIYLWRSEKIPAKWALGFGLAAGFSFLLWLSSWAVALLILKVQPGFVQGLVDAQCSGSIARCFELALLRRLSYIGGFLTLLCLLAPALAFLVSSAEDETDGTDGINETVEMPSRGNPLPYVMLLVLVGGILVLAPDYVYLRDLFMSRSNTVFKFYYQAWIVWSLAAGFGAGVLLQKLRSGAFWSFSAMFVLMVAAALVFPLRGLPEKTNDFQIPTFKAMYKSAREAEDPTALRDALQVWTLNGADFFHAQFAGDAAAADWLAAAPAGVVAEAASQQAYSDFGRMAVYSGQPDVLGWWWHEYQWRGSLDNFVSPLDNLTCKGDFNMGDPRRMRSDDLACLYQTNDWQEAAEVIQQYHIRYVVVGTMEHNVYRVSEAKFKTYLKPAFTSAGVTVYEVP